MSYKSRLKRDLERFVEEGVIARDQAEGMLLNIPEDRSMLSVANILIVLAALLFGAALFSFIAANWDLIPRLVRLSFVVAIIWVGYLGSAACLKRQQKTLAEGLCLLALISFAAGLALIEQIYHLSGDDRSAVLLCYGASLIAALFLRLSTAGAAMSVFVATYLCLSLWLGRSPDNLAFLWITPLLLLPAMASALWIRSKIAIHLTALVAVFFALSLPYHFDAVFWMWAVAGVGIIKFLAAYLLQEKMEQWIDRDGASLFYSAAMVLAALLILQIDAYDDQISMILVTGTLVIGFIIAILFSAGERMALRWLSYAAFGFEVLYLYVETVGSILGTAGFFAVLGIFVLLIALLVIRLERRFHQGGEKRETRS